MRTVAQLRDELRKLGLPTTGLKQDLEERLQEALTQQVQVQVQQQERVQEEVQVVHPAVGMAEVANPKRKAAPREEDSEEQQEVGVAPERKKQRVDVVVAAAAAAAEPDPSPLPELVPAEMSYVSCPYLGTIQRPLLDFDFEKTCSVTLEKRNVYVCLVCGRYLAGRSVGTPVMEHSMQVQHHVFMHLGNGRVYCLPEGYEVLDSSLNDIRFQLKPSFTQEDIRAVDRPVAHSSASSANSNLQQQQQQQLRLALDGTPFVQGILGINNLGKTDASGAVLQCLARVPRLRDWFLLAENTAEVQTGGSEALRGAGLILSKLGEFLRRLFNPRPFRAHISPHELLHTISRVSDKRFAVGEQADPNELFAYFLAMLNMSMRARPNLPASSKTIVQEVFQGVVRVRDRKALTDSSDAEKLQKQQHNWSQSVVPFFFLSLDIPPPPIFRKLQETEKQAVLQTSLLNMLSKFDGEHDTLDAAKHMIRRQQLVDLPPCLVLNVKRFTKNQFFKEKNPTVVTFPFQGLDMSPYLATAPKSPMLYDLMAVIAHDGPVDKGTYSSFVLHHTTGKWLHCDDLRITDVSHDLDRITLSEICTLVYVRR